jgi:hypothetical protein
MDCDNLNESCPAGFLAILDSELKYKGIDPCRIIN